MVGIIFRIIPGGSSVPVLPKMCDTVLMDFDALKDVTSGLGKKGCNAQTTRYIKVISSFVSLYMSRELCQCTSREGTAWLDNIKETNGYRGCSLPSEIDKMQELTKTGLKVITFVH
jgi:NADH:ubiquinone oxidoreductase subunit F (NADH-binding)